MRISGSGAAIALWSCVAASAVAGPSFASTVFTTGLIPSGLFGSDVTEFVFASRFELAAPSTITGGGVYLFDAEKGTFEDWDGTFRYYLFDEAADEPGQLLASGDGVDIQRSATTIPSVVSGVNLELFEFELQTDFDAAANTPYWLGLSLAAGLDLDNSPAVDQPVELAWARLGPPLPGPFEGGAFRVSAIDNWISSGVPQHVFFLTSDPVVSRPGVVPLPGAGLLLATGFGALAILRRNRRGAGTRPA